MTKLYSAEPDTFIKSFHLDLLSLGPTQLVQKMIFNFHIFLGEQQKRHNPLLEGFSSTIDALEGK